MKTSWHVATAAEASAAAQFARLGFDVSVQYGASQPEYDLVIVDGEKLLKISVKGSQTGSWGLSQSQLQKGGANYTAAAEKWFERHKPGTALCLVQFKGVDLDQMPRTYLATPREIADRLIAASGGRGGTILHEDKTRGPKAHGAGTVERLPEEWKLSEARVRALMAK